MSPDVALTWNEALSGIFGSISLAAWIFLLVPQLVENYTNGHADGISMPFLFIWAAGDILSLAGGLWAGLVPTVIALAIYFCFADGALIAQCTYYNTLNAKKDKAAAAAQTTTTTESDPLLASAAANPPRRKSSTTSQSRRRRSTLSHASHRRDSLSRALAPSTSSSAWAKNSLSILAICLAGSLGWFLAYKTGAWHPVPLADPASAPPTPLGASILGYGSALLYLGARVPQIIKNQRDRSCEGLSLLFFLLSLLGNATYGAGILFHSLERRYVVTNVPWLLGSLGTMVEDGVIFVQFRVFGDKQEGEGEAVA
ncbi:hypothetical protein WHR41_06549 [Cladosporium halotolerans]|uniref:Vacuolar membrane PQ loop repeat protein n=1 Tax=Cladosporium halotolerans TaxID=1052096 RepID=A0AB34KMI7_9PEZI